MSNHDAKAGGHDSHGSVKTYMYVFFALIIGTILTVGAYFVHLPTVFLTVLVALLIAGAKASLVAGWFMHLTAEKKVIYVILAFTVFFFLGLMGLTIHAMIDIPKPRFP